MSTVNANNRDNTFATWMAGAIGFLMIAGHIAAKATRDAVFLSTFPVTELPKMLVVGALVSLLLVVFTSRAMVRWEPQRIVPGIFLFSGLVYLGLWAGMSRAPGTMAIALYLHVSAVGVILISGFWSLLNERFDPRSAKRNLGRVVAASTLGGLMGGVAAERMGAWLNVATVPLILGAGHVICAAMIRTLGQTAHRSPESASGSLNDAQDSTSKESESTSALKVLRKTTYLRNLGLLVVLGTVTAACLDYVYKAHAAERFASSQSLMRFFAVYYLVVGLVTFAVQTAFSRRSLERLGLGKTSAFLPVFTAIGGVGVLAAPGLISAVVARFSEAVLRSSLFRSAYELFYVPIRPSDKRATKTIIDVGFDRLGDVIGGGLIALALYLLSPSSAKSILLGAVILLSVAALFVVNRLQKGYVATLEQRLRSRSAEADTIALDDPATRSILMRTATDLGGLQRSQQLETLLRTARAAVADGPESRARPPSSPQLRPADPLLDQIAALRSGDVKRIRAVLIQRDRLDGSLTPHLIPLLARDGLQTEVVDVLRVMAPRVTGQLLDALLDPREEFIIRRRIPKALADCATDRTAGGMVRALSDRRFEVRYKVGIALALLHAKDKTLKIDSDAVFDAVRAELDVDQHVWHDRRLLDSMDVSFQSVFADDLVQSRAERSLEHVFTLLSLAMDSDALRIAYRGLHTEDEMLRGTALEYLDVVLPSKLRDDLWAWIGDGATWKPRERTAKEARSQLMKSSRSIEALLSASKIQVPATTHEEDSDGS